MRFPEPEPQAAKPAEMDRFEKLQGELAERDRLLRHVTYTEHSPMRDATPCEDCTTIRILLERGTRYAATPPTSAEGHSKEAE